MAKIKPIAFDYRGSLLPKNGISQAQIDRLKPALLAARDEVLTNDLHQGGSGDVPADEESLDADFQELPERTLDAYQSDRGNSELGKILATAARLRQTVDKVVVLGIGVSHMGLQALMETCCDPYHNELPRSARGGRPRMYFEGNNVDNDWSQALLQFLATDTTGDGPEGKWAIVVVSKSGGDLESAVAFRQFTRKLEETVGREHLPDLIVPITGESSRLARLADAIGAKDRFLIPAGVDGRFSVFSAVGLLPAAILGIDIVKMLEAAAAMNTSFRSAEMGQNPVLDYVSVNHLLEKEQNIVVRVLSVWSKSLQSAGFWYDYLLAESPRQSAKDAFPVTVVNSRGLNVRAQQHTQCVPDMVMNNVVVGSWRCDPLPIGQLNNGDWDQDQLDELADKTLPDIMTAAIEGTNAADREENRPTTNLHLPAADEAALGQLFQMLMLAIVLEARLKRITPYGQPGVKKYRTNMNQILREG